MSVLSNLKSILAELPPHVQLVAVSKTKSPADILEAYQAGQRIFAENRVQELIQKQPVLPPDIQWHLIGHLQTNKVKYIAAFVDLIHSVDSLKLLQTIDKEAAKKNRVIKCLLQYHIATEESKYGLSKEEGMQLVSSREFNGLSNVKICGVMGMASFTDDHGIVREEFRNLKNIYTELKERYFSKVSWFTEISMGMSGDYTIAIEEGSTMIRLGSVIFGKR